MQIRQIEPRDFAKVADLENKNWTLESTPVILNASAEKILDKIMKGSRYFLAEDEENGDILGILDCGSHHVSEFASHVLTFGVMTVEKARGKGVASSLIKYIIQLAKDEGYKKISIRAMGTNPTALSLYTKLGFVIEGQLKAEFFINGKYVDDYFLAYYLDERIL